MIAGAAGLLAACAADPRESTGAFEAPVMTEASPALGWNVLDDAALGDERLHGAWENPAAGHVVSFSGEGVEVFHVLDDFCIRDDGVVPDFALYGFGERRDALWLHHYDFRRRPELLASARVFRRLSALPEACAAPAADRRRGPAEVFDLVIRSFDRFYPFFDERGVDWPDVKRRYAARAGDLSTEHELFELLIEMLAPLADGHLNVTGAERSWNAGKPELRVRLRDAWAASGSELSEGAYVSTWHRGILESVYGVLDPDSLRSGAAGALEWGTVGGRMGYVRIHRFSRFTEGDESRPAQYDALEAALAAMRADLTGVETLLVDVAMNGGGSDAAAQIVASHFADRRRRVLRYEEAGAPPRELFVSPRDGGERRPILLLTSEVTASAAEAFVLMMRGFPHVTQVGERTRGDLSSLLPKPFPNDLRVTLAYQRVLGVDGVSYEGVGIPPARPLELFPEGNLDGGFAAALAALAADPSGDSSIRRP
ncbi:MAG: S41 family peptidase [Acidobacteriota bacterium]